MFWTKMPFGMKRGLIVLIIVKENTIIIKHFIAKILFSFLVFILVVPVYSQIVHFGTAYKIIELDAGQFKADLEKFDLRVRKIVIPEEEDSFFVVVVRNGKVTTARNFISELEFRDLVESVNVLNDSKKSDLEMQATYMEHIFLRRLALISVME